MVPDTLIGISLHTIKQKREAINFSMNRRDKEVKKRKGKLNYFSLLLLQIRGKKKGKNKRKRINILSSFFFTFGKRKTIKVIFPLFLYLSLFSFSSFFSFSLLQFRSKDSKQQKIIFSHNFSFLFLLFFQSILAECKNLKL